jgi:hypothetical protein
MNEDVEELVVEVAGSMGDPKLHDLVEKLRDEGLSFGDATKTVYALWKQDALDLLEPSLPSTLLRYALSLQSLWFWALTALVASIIPIVFYVADPPFLYLRYVLGSLFVLYLPGSMLIEALYPKSQDLESLERLALSIGLSLAVTPLIGLFLNYTPWGIRLTPITISLATFTEAMAITALTRKYRYYALTRPRP